MYMDILNKEIIPKIDLDKYNYDLPKNRIANFPLEDRSKSKLLYFNKRTQEIKHKLFSDLPGLIHPRSLLIFNNTKVIAARLNMIKDTGGSAELLCVEPSGNIPDPQIAMSQKKESIWVCIVGGKRIKEGKMLHSADNTLKAEILKRFDNKALVRFFWEIDSTFAQIIETIGNVPLPPYIKRAPEKSDKERYQTVYANYDGSVAAPTAGLHFTDDIIHQIRQKGNTLVNVTLHVGPGTFKPIESQDIADHDMHREMISVEKNEIVRIIDHLETNPNSKIIAIGTTSVRTIETLYWIGIKLHYEETLSTVGNEIILNQWEPYRLMDKYKSIDSISSFRAIVEYLNENKSNRIIARTKLFIMPGYQFGVINGIITNYHLPKSTLILLVASFLKDDIWKSIYQEALKNNYRFLSYGDSSFLL
jgi:S-adenosylmethionine:tRNA ribosyltransferase-isomerase